MATLKRPVVELDPAGFNEMQMCRVGPMLYNKNDFYVGGALRKYGECCWQESELFRQIVLPGQVVVEVGANFGIHTVLLSKLANPGGAVFAFEPQRLVFQALCANLALNQCVNVFAYQQAIGAENGQLEVPFLDPTTEQNFGALSLIGSTRGETVPVQTLDDWALPACHLLKADVEGMERDVLTGARDTIAKHRPILYVENDRKDQSKSLIELVFSLGYAAYWHLPPLFSPGNFAGDAEDIFPGVVSINMLCTPAEVNLPVSGVRKIISPDEDWERVHRR